MSAWADSDLVEMQKVGSDDNLTILVQIDKPYIGARRLYIAPGKIYNLGEMGIIDMCDWHTLYDFLEWGAVNYPAERYFLILWDHGTGWTLSPHRSFGSDWSSGNQLSISNGDLQRGVKGFYNATGKKLHIIGFDACLMQQIEVAYEVKGYARIQIAPQTLWPIAGLPYDEILSLIQNDPGMNEFNLAEKVVELCREYYKDTLAVSSINLERLDGLKEKILRWSEDLMIKQPDVGFTDLRNRVQSISLVGTTPQPTDDYIDLGDFLDLLNDYIKTEETQDLVDAYKDLVIKSIYIGDSYKEATGLATWFPDRYIEFKGMIDAYCQLDYTTSNWHRFLNWFYGEDDMRPKDLRLEAKGVGRDNDFHLFWYQSFDLAPVSYNIIECCDTSLIFSDACEDSGNWILSGFTIVDNEFHSGKASVFSGNISNLNNYAETRTPISLENFGFLNFYIKYITEDMTDSLIVEYGGYKEVYYGNSKTWQNCRLVLPSGNYPLRFIYRTNASVNCGGAYIDDIKLYHLTGSKFTRANILDTTIYVFNKLRGKYLFAGQAVDWYGNRSNLSNFVPLTIENYALPYSNPNPFNQTCEIILDYPDSLRPGVYIYSISGRLIRRFSNDEIYEKKVYWNGKDENGRDVGSGLYFVLVKDKDFKKIGKIARQR